MARVPQVTRTIQTTKAVIMCLNIEKEETERVEVTLPRTYKDEQSLLKAAKKVIENDSIKVVYIVSCEVNETLYGMSEEDFIKYAAILPARKAVQQTIDA